MASFNNLSALYSHLEKVVSDSLNDEVASKVKKEISDSVKDIVYGAGEPVEYERRYFDNGSESLGDVEQMNHIVNDNVLEVSDNADFNHNFARKSGGYGDIDLNKSLTYNIEYGYGSRSEWWNKPRGFIEHARDELAEGKARQALKEGLEKRLGKGSVV